MIRVRLIPLLLGLLMALTVQAEGDNDYVEYIELKPPFLANYGGPGPLKYLKAEVSVKVISREAEVAIKHHRAHIRNNLVLLLSRQTDHDIGSAVGREQLRQLALEEVRQVLVSEEGPEVYEAVADLLFTRFVIQN
jgi:flagellar FliL protein